jgi:hypothetical protein
MIRLSRHRRWIFVVSLLAAPLGNRVRAQALPEWLVRVNLYRGTAGLPPLAEDASYNDGEKQNARYIVKTDTLKHSEDPANRWYTPEGAAAAAASNIVALPTPGASEEWAIDLWMQAPFHAVGILDPKLHSTGFGIYSETKGGYQTGASLDILRGRRGLHAGVTFPIVWPGPGSSVPLTSYIAEYPDPLSSCPGYVAPAGLPIVVQFGTGSVAPAVTASTFSSSGMFLDHCVFSETSYVSDDPTQQDLGRSILASRNAIVIIPKTPLTPGVSYNVSLTTAHRALRWSFSADPTAGCTYGMTQVAATAPAARSGGGYSVKTAAGCDSTPKSNPTWISPSK